MSTQATVRLCLFPGGELWKAAGPIFDCKLVTLVGPPVSPVSPGFSSSSPTTRGLSEACQSEGLEAGQKGRGLTLTVASLTGST